MKTSKPIPTKENSNPTHPPAKVDMDELAKQWIELVLSHIQKAPVVFPKNSSYNNVIGQFELSKL